MSTSFLEPPGQLLDAAKQAALDAVAGYERVNRYTVGIAVQAAAAVLRTDVHPPTNRLTTVDSWEVGSGDVTPRLRLLESVVDAARSSHSVASHRTAEPCVLCAALRRLEQAS
jgi:hypothetical protein